MQLTTSLAFQFRTSNILVLHLRMLSHLVFALLTLATLTDAGEIRHLSKYEAYQPICQKLNKIVLFMV